MKLSYSRIVLLCLLACGPEPATTDTTGGSSSSTSTGASTGQPTGGDGSTGTTTGDVSSDTGATTDAGVCHDWEATDPGQDFPSELSCGLPELCPGDAPLEFILAGGSLESPDSVTTADIARARCMAAALRDRTPGQISFGAPLAIGSDHYVLEILGPTVIRRRSMSEDFAFDKYVRVRPLLPPDAYAGCAEGTAKQVWTCLTKSFEDVCVTGELACPLP